MRNENRTPAEASKPVQAEAPSDVVAFEFYSPATGHAIVDYTVNTHVGRLGKEQGYEARPLGYVNPPPAAVKVGDPVPLWQAREALDSLEESARGDAPFNHYAANIVRIALEQALAAHSPASGVGERELPPLPEPDHFRFSDFGVKIDLAYSKTAMHDYARAALATQPLEQKPLYSPIDDDAKPEQVAQDTPDMFWDHDDGERFGHDIYEIISDYGPGEIVKIDQAKRLPSVTVRVLPAKDDDSDLEYEFIEDDRAARASGKGGEA